MTVPRTSSTSFRSRRLPGWLLALGVSFVLSILIVLPFFWLGTASGHDFEFHAASWFDAAYQWKEGILYPRWTAWTNHGFGEPRFVFYPPLSWMLGAALTLLLPDPAVPILFVVLVQTFAGLSTFFLLRHLTAHRTALFGAAVYVINPNALLMTYIRSDFAEQLACAIFPLLLLGAFRLCDFLEDSPSTRSSLVLFAIPFAGVWLSNAPAAVIASYSMALLFAYAAISQRSWHPLLRGLAALALGLGLVALYLVPAAYEQRWVNIGQALSSGLLPSQNFLFTVIDDPEHTWFNWIASICALSLMLLLGLATLASRRLSPTSNAGARTRQASLGLLLLGAAATILTLRLSLPLWTYLPKLRFVQFPWRWMSMIALVAACFIAFAMQRRRAWFSALFLLSVSLGYFQVTNTWWDEDEMPTLRDALVSGNGFDGTDEYDPIGDDHLDLPVGAPLVKVFTADSDASTTQQLQFKIQRWSTEQKQIRIDSPLEARVALRLLNYPAWRVSVNGKLISTERMDDVNQMVIPIESGHSDIRVEFIRTTDRKLGNAISTVCAALCVVLLWMDRKQSTKSVSFRNETNLAPVD
jgi:hypothetical protein